MKNVEVQLSIRGINKAIKEIEDYRKEIDRKTQELVIRLANEGVQVANTALMSTVGDSTEGTIGLKVDNRGDIISAVVYLSGKDALFIEFGAGIAYNTGAEHPLAAQFGYGPGTYPSKHPPNKGINPGRWVYGHDDDGKPLWSIGTQASMPIYKAAENARNTAIKTALEIFRS